MFTHLLHTVHIAAWHCVDADDVAEVKAFALPKLVLSLPAGMELTFHVLSVCDRKQSRPPRTD
jgi:hypothetical protein